MYICKLNGLQLCNPNSCTKDDCNEYRTSRPLVRQSVFGQGAPASEVPITSEKLEKILKAKLDTIERELGKIRVECRLLVELMQK